MSDPNYKPFGPQWAKEMAKMPKPALIGLLRKSLIENAELRQQLAARKDQP